MGATARGTGGRRAAPKAAESKRATPKGSRQAKPADKGTDAVAEPDAGVRAVRGRLEREHGRGSRVGRNRAVMRWHRR
eukprot:SAG11_NODE_38_length_21705_cov_24.667453_19_plen_78_part_00